MKLKSGAGGSPRNEMEEILQSAPNNASFKPGLIANVCRVVFLIVTIAGVFTRFSAGARSLAFYDDDFFYYLKVADNLASGHGSTFDGVHRTNGYHPLWFILLAGFSKELSRGALFFLTACLICSSALLTYRLARLIFEQCTKSASVATIGATVIAFSSLYVSRGGMEVVLTLPMAVGLCCYRLRHGFKWNLNSAILYGLLASAVVLSRLDSILLILSLFILEVSWRGHLARKERISLGVACVVCMLPVMVYVSMNVYLFKLPVPISSLAKQLRIHHSPNPAPFVSILYGLPLFARLLIVFPYLLALAFAVWRIACCGWGRLPQRCRPFAVALMIFPLVHLFALSILSDWSLWPWYLYSFILGEFGTGLILISQETRFTNPQSRILEAAYALIVVGMMAVFMEHEIYASHRSNHSIYLKYDAAVAISKFSQKHSGNYAMGDRAGIVGYLLSEPLLQTEGLMMDREYLEKVRKDSSLNDVLKGYDVNYLIATNPQFILGCYIIQEPAQAGKDSHSMHGKYCREPVYRFFAGGVVNDIFELKDPPARR